MKRIALFLVTLLCLSACGSKQQQSGKETLTVTLEPLRYFTEVIAGDKYNVVSMVPKGSSPETYDPTPQQLVNLDKSTAYLRIGYIGFEQAWMDKLTSNAPHLKVFDTSKGIDPIAKSTGRSARYKKIEKSQKQKCEKICIITYRITDEVALLAPTYGVSSIMR